jgi:hypothetical protein
MRKASGCFNWISIAFLFLVIRFPAQSQSCTVAPAGLVSWWTGDTNENDIIGGNNPSMVNAVTLVPGEVKDGFTFGIDGYIEIPAATNLANQQFTWTAWVMPAGPGSTNDQYGSVIVVENSNSVIDVVALDWRDNPDDRFLFVFGDQTYEIIYSTDTFPSGSFYFVAGTYDGTTFRLYVNGISEGSYAETKTIPYNSDPWVIGQSFATTPNFRTWNGIIDELQAYNVALTQAQIQQIYNAGSAGVCKGLTFTPTSLKFPRSTVGTTSAPLTSTVTNAFPLPVAISDVVTRGDFAQTNTCPASPATLLSGATCSVSVTFSPTEAGTRTGWVGFVHNAPASPQYVGLEGASTDIGLSPAALKYTDQVVGTSSAPQTVTVTNVGSTAVNFTGSGIVIAGTDPADFTISNNTCGASLAGDSECTIGVEFTPTANGTLTSTLAFNDDSGASPQTVALGGAATDISLSTTLLDFGSHKVGTTSAAHSVTVTNIGTATVDFTGSGITIAGPDAGDFVISANTCGTSLAGSAQCKVSVEFKPAATGTRTADLLFNDNGGSSPQHAVLYGLGM